jgi:hypothetical protein
LLHFIVFEFIINQILITSFFILLFVFFLPLTLPVFIFSQGLLFALFWQLILVPKQKVFFLLKTVFSFPTLIAEF